jgi:thiol-disulfide isomerase/thioredoxin
MSEKQIYYDKRSELWKKIWNIALPYDEYLDKSDPLQSKRWFDSKVRVPELSKAQTEKLQGYNRRLNVLMYAGIWCGDCARQGPLLKKIVEIIGEKGKFRVIERDASKELQDELRILGALRVPVIIFLTEDFWEVQRFGERTLSIYQSKLAREVGPGADGGILTPKARFQELSEWIDIFERVLIMIRLSPPLRKRYND